jgi:hypothetical protein
MPEIRIKRGLDWRGLPSARLTRYIAVDVVAIGLSQLVSDLHELALYENVKISELKVPVPIILADFADLLQLSCVNREQVLGSEIMKWLEKQSLYMRDRVDQDISA